MCVVDEATEVLHGGRETAVQPSSYGVKFSILL
jgi:hypothetical protein